MQVMEPPERPAGGDARRLIAQLQQSVLAWMDGDRVLPADGSSLLAMLDRAREGLILKSAPEARAATAAFSSRVQALIEAGVIDAADGHPRLEMAAELAALLPTHSSASEAFHPDRIDLSPGTPMPGDASETGPPPLAERNTRQ